MTETKKQIDLISKKDLASLFAAIEKINHRLYKLEAISDLKFEVSHSQLPHPSQERFEVAEAIADGIFDGIQKDRACTFEPNGMPCDHCSMCSCRGF